MQGNVQQMPKTETIGIRLIPLRCATGSQSCLWSSCSTAPPSDGQVSVSIALDWTIIYHNYLHQVIYNNHLHFCTIITCCALNTELYILCKPTHIYILYTSPMWALAWDLYHFYKLLLLSFFLHSSHAYLMFLFIIILGLYRCLLLVGAAVTKPNFPIISESEWHLGLCQCRGLKFRWRRIHPEDYVWGLVDSHNVLLNWDNFAFNDVQMTFIECAAHGLWCVASCHVVVRSCFCNFGC